MDDLPNGGAEDGGVERDLAQYEQQVATLDRVPLRDVWKHEAYDFTKWLQDNLEVLEEATGLSLSGAERERDVGNYSVDLVAEDDANQLVVIENQLEGTDHDHLGKMMVC